MYLFYTNKIDGEWAVLEEAEARHCAQVLRMKEGDGIQFVDGKGNWYRGRLASLHKKECRVSIEQRQVQAPATKVDLHLAVAPTKNIDRFEWFLEKDMQKLKQKSFINILSTSQTYCMPILLWNNIKGYLL